jgi:hypothetical protein
LDGNFIQSLIKDEFANEGYIEMSIEEWQREFDQIYAELNQYLANELLQSIQNDELYHF